MKRGLAPPEIDLREAVRNAWKTNNRVNVYLIEQLPAALWDVSVPGAPRRTVRSIAAHIHNSRCWWIKLLGAEIGIARPESVDRWTVKRKELAVALNRSSRGMLDLLMAGCDRGGRIPASAPYVWRNLPLDVGHVLAYFVSHEGHHRGQIVMLARQSGQCLPREVTEGLWDWTRRARETRRGRL